MSAEKVDDPTLQERFDYLLSMYGRLLAVHARVQMDTPEDRALHARAVEVFAGALERVR
jgi:hypothetical protein